MICNAAKKWPGRCCAEVKEGGRETNMVSGKYGERLRLCDEPAYYSVAIDYGFNVVILTHLRCIEHGLVARTADKWTVEIRSLPPQEQPV